MVLVVYAVICITSHLDKAGLGEQYLNAQTPWRAILALGLTTTPEYADTTRSDTHAWIAYPV
jgi:hypothetical protein